jgi:hypothetical protein
MSELDHIFFSRFFDSLYMQSSIFTGLYFSCDGTTLFVDISELYFVPLDLNIFFYMVQCNLSFAHVLYCPESAWAP